MKPSTLNPFCRVEGAELLQAAIARGDDSSSDKAGGSDEEDSLAGRDSDAEDL